MNKITFKIGGLLLVAGVVLVLWLLTVGRFPSVAHAYPGPNPYPGTEPYPAPVVPSPHPRDEEPPVADNGRAHTEITSYEGKGGDYDFGATSFNAPSSGFQFKMILPAQGSYPDGKSGLGFRGPGDNNLGVFFYDNSTPPQKINLPVPFPVTVCMQYPVTTPLPSYGSNIQYWNGSAWITLPTTAPMPVTLANGSAGYEICTTMPPGGS